MQKSFFQDIFCSGEVNIYVPEAIENENEEIYNEFNEEKNIQTLETNEEKISLNKGELDKGFNIENTKGTNFGMAVNQEMEEHRNYNANKTPIVSGLIFEDSFAKDDQNFVVKNNEINDNDNIETTEEAKSLIELLKNEGIEKTKQKEAIENIMTVEMVEKSEIDLPVL